MLDKRTVRLLVFLCALVVSLTVVAKAVYLKRQETASFLLEHSLFEDVSFSTRTANTQSVKPVQNDSDEENNYIE